MRRGFSLVELLVLLALSTLLISLLMPALQSGREHAILVECQSNLRQLGQIHATMIGDDRWGNSPYDVNSGDGPMNPDGAGQGKQNNPIDPTTVESEGRRLGVDLRAGFDEGLEESASDAPDDWRLLCPVAERDGANSYGMIYSAIYRPMSSLYSSRDVIIGCSDFKVVDVVRNFSLRHAGRANFLFGDLHVGAHGWDLFPESELRKQSQRGAFGIQPTGG
ncbi:MAG: hypothetical protein ACOC0P_05235 [Planctomycetota bacterium]